MSKIFDDFDLDIQTIQVAGEGAGIDNASLPTTDAACVTKSPCTATCFNTYGCHCLTLPVPCFTKVVVVK